MGWRNWSYPHDEHKVIFVQDYNTLEELIIAIRKFEEANELEPIVNLRDILLDYFCRNDEFFGQFCVECGANE